MEQRKTRGIVLSLQSSRPRRAPATSLRVTGGRSDSAIVLLKGVTLCLPYACGRVVCSWFDKLTMSGPEILPMKGPGQCFPPADRDIAVEN